jgi:hypothetical protein
MAQQRQDLIRSMSSSSSSSAQQHSSSGGGAAVSKEWNNNNDWRMTGKEKREIITADHKVMVDEEFNMYHSELRKFVQQSNRDSLRVEQAEQRAQSRIELDRANSKSAYEMEHHKAQLKQERDDAAAKSALDLEFRRVELDAKKIENEAKRKQIEITQDEHRHNMNLSTLQSSQSHIERMTGLQYNIPLLENENETKKEKEGDDEDDDDDGGNNNN